MGQSLRTLPAAHKVVIAIAVAVLGMAGFLFVQWVSVPSYTVLSSGLDDTALADVINELDRLGYDYQIEGGGSRVLVPKADVHKARADLAAAGVKNGNSPDGYELLDGQGLNVSDFKQQIDYQRALEGELAKTLMAMEGVSNATVHLVLPEDSLFSDTADAPEASVLVTTPRKLTPLEVETITFLLASSVEGLEPSGVTVADVDGEVLQAAGEDSMASTITNRNLRMTRDFEQTLAADVQGLLEVAIGPNLASVVVRADLDFDEFSTESETYVPESAVVLKEYTVDETFSGTGDSASGTVGVDGANTGGNLDESNYTRSESTLENVVDRSVTRTVRAPGRINSLSVAVVVDNGALTGATVPTPDEVKSLVEAALGMDPERGDSVVVTSVAFPAPVEVVADAAAEEPVAAAAGNDMIPQMAGAAALLVVAVALLLLTRGKKTPASPDPAAVGALPAPGGRGGAGAVAGGRVPALVGGRAQEDVVGLIERQPQEVAVLLRSWLADRR